MFKTVTLEVSLKPFKKTDEAYIRQVCAGIFEQWRPLIRNREEVNVMLWASDGSELLDYNKNLDDTFEWCYFLGMANRELLREDDPKDISIHQRRRYYTADPPVMTYRILQTIVRTFKEEGAKQLPNAKLSVGATFDIGPEFAISDFKYYRHTELLTGIYWDHYGLLDATAPMHADNHPYAAYPNGVPEGLRFGSFFGAQANIFLKDMGMDFLWLSNGLGFSAHPWGQSGKVYDGEKFDVQQLKLVREKVMEFWELFREECPDVPIHTRGTNNSVGIDYATDGVPLYQLYNSNLKMIPPPNSPCAALTGNYGLELMGHMTRICNLPGEDYMFRYYLHDPWYCNSPWLDRYDHVPTDIYLPMAISRLDEQGNVHTPSRFNILSIDNSYGEMPDCCVYEPLPHFMKAEQVAPDAPAPLVWVYPMKEYTTTDTEQALREMYDGDLFISNAINQGMPLCCVVSTDNFEKHSLDVYRKSILISPVPTGKVLEKLTEFASKGGQVLIYGSKDALETLPDGASFVQVDMAQKPTEMLRALEQFGLSVRFDGKEPWPAIMTVSRNNNAFWFSDYQADTTTQTRLRFPLGAPVLIGCEAELSDGYACYRFPRFAHHECRVFVVQKEGKLTSRETAPVSGAFRRRFNVGGLEDATVYYFPETYCIENAKVNFGEAGDFTPTYDESFRLVHDETYGDYYYAEHVTGERGFLMPTQD